MTWRMSESASQRVTKLASWRGWRLLAGKADAEGGAGFLKQAGHSQGQGVGHDGAFAPTVTNQSAEVRGFVVEAGGFVGHVEFDDAIVDVADGGAAGVPPVFVDGDVAARGGEQGVAAAEQVEAGV